MRSAALTSLVWSVALAVVLIFALRATTGFSPIVERPDLDSASAYTVSPDLVRIAPPIHGTDEERTLQILRFVMNDESNKGLLCAGMAQVFRDALLSIGIPARKIVLKRNLFDTFDTHVTVEAWINGKWRIYDPTFHIKVNASAYEVRDWELKGKGKPLKIEFLGEVAYPARLETYPLRYEAHFNNVFVELRSGWIRPRHVLAYKADHDLSPHEHGLFSWAMFTLLFVLPAIALMAGTLFFVSRGIRSR